MRVSKLKKLIFGSLNPVEVTLWPFDFAPGIKTKFKKSEQEKIKKEDIFSVIFPLGS